MTIQTLKFPVNKELKKEMEFFAETKDGLDIYKGIKTKQDVIDWIEANADFVDFKHVLAELKSGHVLDVGVGWGMSSAYMAIQGFDVTCVEPSKVSCENMKKFFDRLDLKIKIIQGTGETMNQIKNPFDHVVFWSSLHHCDDPLLAVKNAHHVLRPAGNIILFEPVLRFYRSKAWFYKAMESNPQSVGHYGGNEHVYRYPEYLQFLNKAQFLNIQSEPSVKYRMAPKRAPWDNPPRWVLKKGYYKGAAMIAKPGNPVSNFLTQLSLLTPIIKAQKST